MRRAVLAILVLLHLALGGLPDGAAWCERDAGLDLSCAARVGVDTCCAPVDQAPADVDCCAELDPQPALQPTLPELPALSVVRPSAVATADPRALPPRRLPAAVPLATGPPPHLVVLRRTQLLI